MTDDEKKARGVLAGTFGAALVLALFFSSGAFAQSVRVAGGLSRGAADALYCLLTGCTMTGGITFSGASPDVATPSGEDFEVILSGGGADIWLRADIIRLQPGFDSAGMSLQEPAANVFLFSNNSGANSGRIGFTSTSLLAGVGSDQAATTAVAQLGDSVSSTIAETFSVYGERTARFTPGDALTLGSGGTDTTSTPLGSGTTGAGTACRVAATEATAWTPSETGAVTGMFWCCTNTSAFAITMTDADGVYEGPGSVVDQWDQVCFEYVTDRFIERSYSNNEP